uniref:Uncharacterized protein n=1 Tax=Strigamia maritima TaxID=126957 RepID=T1IM12_STRMM
MKLLLVLTLCLVLAYAAEPKEEEEKCFKFSKADWKAKIKERLEKKFKPVIDECKKEKPNADESAIKQCCKDKVKAAWKDCKSSKNSRKECLREKLNLEKTQRKNLTKEEIKDNIVKNLINENKKEAVNTAITACNSKEGREYWLCCIDELAKGPCPELKSFSSKIIAWKKKVEQWADKE